MKWSKHRRALADDYLQVRERRARAAELVEAADALVMLDLQDRKIEDWLRERAKLVLISDEG